MILMKNIEGTHKLKGVVCSQIGRINIIITVIYPKQCTNSMQSLSKHQRYFSTELRNNPRMYMKPQKTLNSQSNFEEKDYS